MGESFLSGMPPINANSSSRASSALDASGQINPASGDGDWTVNFGAGSGGLSPMVMLGLGALVLIWFLRNK